MLHSNWIKCNSWLGILLVVAFSAGCDIKYPEPAGMSGSGGKAENITPTVAIEPVSGVGSYVQVTKDATPLSAWNSIPVMPGAREASNAGSSYVFVVDAPVNEVDQYYQNSMAGNGWKLQHRDFSSVGMFGGPAVKLKYERGVEEAKILMAYSKNNRNTITTLLHSTLK